MRSRCPAVLTAVFLALAAAGTPALAQAPAADGWSAARWRFGPLAVTPAIEVRNLGWDSNVFAEGEGSSPDFTSTVAAPVDWWLRFGRGRLHGVDTLEGVYFGKYASQRGFNQRHDLTLLLPLNRVRPYVGGSFLSTNDRPGYEVTARVRHSEAGVNAGVVVRIASRIDLDISGRQTTFRFKDDEFAGSAYARMLDRRDERYGAQLRYRLTPLTTVTLLADSVRERYTQAVERNNDGFRILPGVEFGPNALIKGVAQIGYRRLNTVSSAMPDFSGLVANVELSSTFRGFTRVTAGFSRDIRFSYEIDRPFYVQPGVTASVTQQVSGPWDVQARGGWYTLDYRQARPLGDEPASARVDHFRTLGGGLGYRVGRDFRVGFNLDTYRRESAVPNLDYQGVRGGMVVTYVFK